MSPKLGVAVFFVTLIFPVNFSSAAESKNYPPPRFPSYVRPPKSIEDIMPFARAAVRQTGGRTPLGLVEQGQTVAIFAEPAAEEMVMQAIKRAYEERGVKIQIVPEHQLLGVSREEALKAVKANRWFTSEQGYMEVRAWLLQRFGDAEVPKKWLKERRPDLYKLVFQREDDTAQELVDLGRKFGGKSVGEAIVKYLDQHKDINAVFWRRGGRTVTRKSIEPYGSKYFGNFIFDNRYELMNKAATFPGDLWRLAEERVVEPLSWVDRVEVNDPEGTNFAFELDEKQAQSWAEGAYQQGHLFMFPHQATGRFPLFVCRLPGVHQEIQPTLFGESEWRFRRHEQPHRLVSACRSARERRLCERGQGRRRLRRVVARISQISKNQRTCLSFPRPTGLLVDLRSWHGHESKILQTAG